ncbi:MAG: DUF6893 family small protein [Pyrinomonadaceae bacterium]
MKLEQTAEVNMWRNAGQKGFSLLVALVVVLFFAFIAAVAMNLMRVRWAILGFVVAVILATVIATLPDLMRYMRISSM